MNIAGLAINRPVFIVMIVLSIITLGVLGYSRLPVDLMPNVDFPMLVVVTLYPGASSEEVETLITKPLENALGSVEGLDTLSSTSREGLSLVFIQFKIGVDIKFSELRVREKVGQATTLFPQNVTIQTPTINRFSSDDVPIAWLSITGNRDRTALNEILQNDVQPRIESVNGVGSISIYGVQNRIVKIAVNESLMIASGISYKQIVAAVMTKNISYPAGTLFTGTKNIDVRVYGKAETVEDFGNMTLTSATGRQLRVKDIATVTLTNDIESTRARVNQQNSVLFSVIKQSGGNTVSVVDGLRDALPNIEKLLPSDIKLHIVSDSSLNIRRSISGVQSDILTGALLAIIIVWLFLGNFRSTIITAVALPDSLLGAFFLVAIAGFSLNTMTLMSLSLAVGLLIDDSIVVRENIFRYVEHGLGPKEAAEKGTNEVALAVLSTTLSILAVFIPISFLTGIIGQFLREFGLTVAFALIISLLDAFTTAPMLSAYWYKKTDKSRQSIIGKFFSSLTDLWNRAYDVIKSVYISLLKWGLNHKIAVVSTALLLFVGSLLVFSVFVGKNLLNNTDSGSFSISLELYPGAPLDMIDGYAKDVESFLAKQKDINTFYTIVGQGGPQNASINVDMKAIKDRKTSTQEMIATVRGYIRKKYEKSIMFRLTESGGIASLFGGGGPGGGGGYNTPIAINIYGRDLDVLQDVATKVQTIVSETPGASDVNSTYRPGNPEFVIKLNSVKAESMGVSVYDLGGMLRDLITGDQISTFTLNNWDYYVVIRLGDSALKKLDNIKNLYVPTKSGRKISLASICDFSYSSAPLQIRHQNKQRLIRISANSEPGYSLSQMIDAISKSISKKINFPLGYTYEFTGQQTQFADLGQQIGLAIILAVLFMYMILASLYNSFIQPLFILLSIPLAMIGAFLALLVTGTDIDIYGYIGILLIMGLVAKNAILLIDFTNKSREDGMSVTDSLLHAGPIRLRPILMTSFAMIFGMLPLALGMNEGSRGRQALPVAVIGGILTSTFLTLIVVPVLYEWIEGWIEKRNKTRKIKA